MPLVAYAVLPKADRVYMRTKIILLQVRITHWALPSCQLEGNRELSALELSTYHDG